MIRWDDMKNQLNEELYTIRFIDTRKQAVLAQVHKHRNFLQRWLEKELLIPVMPLAMGIMIVFAGIVFSYGDFLKVTSHDMQASQIVVEKRCGEGWQ